MYFGLCLLVQTLLFGPVATGEGKSPGREKGRDTPNRTWSERSPWGEKEGDRRKVGVIMIWLEKEGGKLWTDTFEVKTKVLLTNEGRRTEA